MKKGDKKLHFLDRYLGIPLVFFLGLGIKKNKKVPSKNEIRKIGILNPASIGDTVLLFGIIEDIKKALPQASITFFSGTSNHAIAVMCLHLDKVVKLKLSDPFKDIKKIKAEGGFDVFIDCMPWPRINGLLTFFSNSKITIGFKTPGQHKHFVYNCRVLHSDHLHEIDNLRNLIKVLGINDHSFPKLNIKSDKNSNIAVLHMYPSGYKSYKKMWPETHWLKVIHHLQEKGITVYLTGGKEDKEHAKKFIHKYNLPDVVNVAGHLNLKETMLLINSSSLTISVNTGIMHVAAALNTYVISLNGPTSVKRWGPVSANPVCAIQSPHNNAPCLNLGFEYNCKNENCNCMAMITPEEVIQKIELHIHSLTYSGDLTSLKY